MVDVQFHVWLLEVNGAPACAKLVALVIGSPYHTRSSHLYVV